jgi:tol-pal system protein YbgF
MAAAVMAAVFFAAPVAAQGRLSLSERVARLESQAQGQGSGQSTVDLLNRIGELQAEVQSLRSLTEQQAFEIENLKKSQRDQYTDLDARLARLEAGMSTARPADPAAQPAASAPAAPAEAAPSQLAPEELQSEAAPAAPVEDLTSEPAASGDPVSEKAGYDEAFAALREGRYAESARRFATFLDRYPQGEYADNATYWLGESYYVTQNYQIALDTFQDLLTRFPDSSKAPDALLKVGYCHYELKNWQDAESSLNEVVRRYPDTTVARLAQGRLRALRLEGTRQQ